MSLCCHECKEDMGPSEKLPGREGTFIYPVLMSMVYLPPMDKSGKITYKMSYLGSEHNRALCFECIEKEMPEDRIETIIKPIYDCYDAETKFKEIEEEQTGRFCNGSDSKVWLDAYDMFEGKIKSLKNDCIFCDGELRNGSPYFTAIALDRVYSRQKLSGLFVPTNYSWSNFKTGTTSFGICFDDFMKHFPETFETLSYDMLGEKNPKHAPKPSELIITPEFEEGLERQTGKKFDDALREILPGNEGLKIIRTKFN